MGALRTWIFEQIEHGEAVDMHTATEIAMQCFEQETGINLLKLIDLHVQSRKNGKLNIGYSTNMEAFEEWLEEELKMEDV